MIYKIKYGVNAIPKKEHETSKSRHEMAKSRHETPSCSAKPAHKSYLFLLLNRLTPRLNNFNDWFK